MLIDLLAVLEDGSAPDPLLPTDIRKAISFPAGETVTLRIRLVTRAAVPIDLAGGDSLVVVARELASPSSRVEFNAAATKSASRPSGFYDAVITTDQSAWLGEQGRLLFDIWLRRTAGNFCVFPSSSMILMSASSPPSAPPTPSVP